MTTSTNPGEFAPRRSKRLLAAILFAIVIALAIFLCSWIVTRPRPPIGLPTPTPFKWSVSEIIPLTVLDQAPPFVPGFYCNSCSSPECI